MAKFWDDIIGSGSAEEAKEHIENIRDDYGLGDVPRPMANHSLTKALEIIASELYSESTHFLLELIQNANDNEYPDGVAPEIEFQYKNGYLRVDCNEKGFSPKNVEAICQIGNSTKSGENKKKDSQEDSPIGEKGIGFKSVFKVADVVFITSRNYSFKFDSNTPLGMVAPTWSDPPRGFTRRSNFTSFYLHLSSNERKNEVIQQLDKLDSTILTFLQKLRRISVVIEEGRKRTLIRQDGTEKLGKIIVLHQDRQARNYILVEHKVKSLPAEKKRPGITESDIRLAFPLDEGGAPLIKRQQVFAYLPLREYGFQYLIHGDFLALANREDVDTSSPWNKKLRLAVVEATVKAAHQFNKGALKYSWFRFLPWKTPVYGFFRKAADSMFDILKDENVLENFNGDLKKPRTLCFVPREFCDAKGIPITLTPKSAQRYLSKCYETTDKDALVRLGVTEMTVEVFIEEVQKLIADDKKGFRARPKEWHSRLALVLEQEGKKANNKNLIFKLDLIPLRDGRWVSGSEEDVFFPADTVGFAIPGGLRCNLVADHAVQDIHRRLLFQYLGVGKIDSHSLSQAIEKWHTIEQYGAELSFEDLFSQLIFMFNVRWRSKNRYSTLWIVTEDNRLRRGCDVYMDSDEPSAATTLLDRKRFHFIHPKFLNATGKELRGAWQHWLKESLNISTHPKLVGRIGGANSNQFEVHDHFKHLLANAPSTVVLQLLRDNWNHYSEFIEHDDRDPVDEGKNRSRARIREYLQSIQVKCTDDRSYELCRTFLPLKELEKIAHGCIPFVDVPDPDCYSWRVTFHCLGVGYTDDLAFYITCLKGLKQVADPPQRRICTLLEQIQARSGDDKDGIRDVFEKRELIYIPRSSPGKGFWVKPSKCIWAGPTFLRSVYALSELYPDNKRLFSSLIGLQDATMRHLIQETSQFTTSDDIKYITDVFKELEKFITDKTLPSETIALTKHAMFPVISSAESPRFDCLRSSDARQEWWIADTTHLAVSFRGIIPLLALNLEDVGKLKRLFKAAKVDLRKLSHAVEGIASTDGVLTPWQSYTSSLRAKANSILRLVPDTEPNRKRIFKQLRNVEAFKAPKVIQKWQVDYQGSPTKGREEIGHVALGFDGDSLHLFFANDSVGTTKVKWELVERLYSYCGMKGGKEEDREPKFLLTQILDTDSQEQIDDLLDRAAVPPLPSDEEVDEAADRLNRNYARKGKHKSATGGDDSIWAARRAFIENLIANNTYLISGKHVLAASLFGLGSGGGNGAKLFGFDGTKAMEGVSIFRVPFGRNRSNAGNKRMRAQANEQVARKGEEAIHEVLLSLQESGLKYEPVKHWTSKRNPEASNDTKGLEENANCAAFTLPDPDGIFTYYLTLVGYEPAEKWFANPPTYHIEVKSTKAGLDDPFDFTRKEFERARSFATSRAPGGIVSDVCVLARVFDVEGGDVKKAFMPDLFERYMEGEIKLDPMDDFEGKIVRQG